MRTLVRAEDGRDLEPSAAVLDSQTVRSDAHGGKVGFDASKKTKGRKRFIVVDSLGMLLGVVVVPASVPERLGAQRLLEPPLPALGTLRKLWVDGGYSGPDFANWVRTQSPGLEAEVIKRSDDVHGFKVLPKRWVVEKDLRMARATSTISSGLREDRVQCGRLDRHRTHARHAAPPGFTWLQLTFRTGSERVH